MVFPLALGCPTSTDDPDNILIIARRRSLRPHNQDHAATNRPDRDEPIFFGGAKRRPLHRRVRLIGPSSIQVCDDREQQRWIWIAAPVSEGTR